MCVKTFSFLSELRRLRWTLPGVLAIAVSMLWVAPAPAADKQQFPLLKFGSGSATQRVIVAFDAPVASGRMDSAAARSAQSRIGAVQRRLLARLPAGSVIAENRYRYLPLLSLTTDAAGLRQLSADPEVTAVFRDRLAAPGLTQSVPLLGAPALWQQVPGVDGSGQAIAVLDTGVDDSHPFLTGKVVAEACFSSTVTAAAVSSLCPSGAEQSVGPGSAGPCALDDCDHGTHIAGIAAGRGTAFSGMARGADLISVQIFSRFTSAADCAPSPAPCVLSFTSDQIEALEHVYALRDSYTIASVNLSLGAGRYDRVCDGEPAKQAIDLLGTAGIATVAAAGNAGSANSINSPACISSAISVGATSALDSVSAFSNSASMLDVLAPGSGIESSVPGGQFAVFNGTSMATPHVAGALALLRSARPISTIVELLDALKDSGVGLRDQRNQLTRPAIQVDDALAVLSGGVPAAGRLSVSPAADLTVAGPTGGPFAANLGYELHNAGTAALQFSVKTDRAWLGATPSSGTLAPAARITINIDPNAGANLLPVGSHEAVVTFEDNRSAVTRSVVLTATGANSPNDKLEDSLEIPDSFGVVNGSNYGAGKEIGEPNHGAGAGGASVWWSWTALDAGQATFDTRGSSFDTLLGVYTGDAAENLLEVAGNDDISASTEQSEVSFNTFSGQRYSIAVDGAGGVTGNVVLNWTFTTEQIGLDGLSVTPATTFNLSGEPGGPFVPGTLSYTLTNVSSRSLQYAVTDVPLWLTPSSTGGTVAAGASATVALAINSRAAELAFGENVADVRFNSVRRRIVLSVRAPAAPNDNFGSASVVSGGTVDGFNVGASGEPGEPNHADRLGGSSVWWRWTAPANGSFRVSTEGSSFDTTLGVYRGASLNALDRVLGNDDSNGTEQSSGAFKALRGETYRIAVDGFLGATGAVKLAVGQLGSRPDNDDFSAAVPLQPGVGRIEQLNTFAGAEAGETGHGTSRSGGHSLWWEIAPGPAGTVDLDTLGSDFDTTMAVYRGNLLNGLQLIIDNDDATSTEFQSRVQFEALAAIRYYVAVDGFAGAAGNVVLNFRIPVEKPMFQSGFENP